MKTPQLPNVNNLTLPYQTSTHLPVFSVVVLDNFIQSDTSWVLLQSLPWMTYGAGRWVAALLLVFLEQRCWGQQGGSTGAVPSRPSWATLGANGSSAGALLSG